ncbi:hypothetical protein San01_01390 [Streptomyces angustmyceticus]|uniref:Uncharacterized protein n=1 Tax=Streptomyces angustmyceticus TaxID=285578 RepID=A0A5J4L0N8_9ACTN|nr:hypothetical protein San01_01390 [Streptomyces angustmyceticus]
MREERLAVEGQLDPSGGAGEQPDGECALKGGDALRHGLLGDAELVGRVLQLPEFGRADERPHRLGIHRPSISVPNRWLWLSRGRLFDPGRVRPV